MTGPGVEQSIIGPKKTKDCSKPSSCMFPGFSSPDNRGPRACAELIGIGSRFNWFPSLMIVILVATQKPEPLICSVEVHQPLVSQSKKSGRRIMMQPSMPSVGSDIIQTSRDNYCTEYGGAPKCPVRLCEGEPVPWLTFGPRYSERPPKPKWSKALTLKRGK